MLLNCTDGPIESAPAAAPVGVMLMEPSWIVGSKLSAPATDMAGVILSESC